MAENKKFANVGDRIKTVSLDIGVLPSVCMFNTVYELGGKYTEQNAGVLRVLPHEYNFFNGRLIQKNKDGTECFPITRVVIEFFVDNTPYYVSGDNFHDSVERAILMQTYLNFYQKQK